MIFLEIESLRSCSAITRILCCACRMFPWSLLLMATSAAMDVALCSSADAASRVAVALMILRIPWASSVSSVVVGGKFFLRIGLEDLLVAHHRLS